MDAPSAGLMTGGRGGFFGKGAKREKLDKREKFKT